VHWSKKYISRPYSELNCAQLVELVIRDEFEINFKFPQSNDNIFYESRKIRQEFQKYVDPQKVGFPKEGDLVLMNAQRRMCHVGIFVEYRGQNYILHSLKQAGSVCLHRVPDLEYYGLTIEGFYSWLK